MTRGNRTGLFVATKVGLAIGYGSQACVALATACRAMVTAPTAVSL